MMALQVANKATMSSREIAELTGKEHRHVLRDVRAMLIELGIGDSGYAQIWTDPQNGQKYPEFRLPEDLTITLVSGYSVPMRHKIVKRWKELEAEKNAPTVAAPNLSDAATLRTMLLGYTEQVLALENKVAEQAPAVAAQALLAGADGALCITNAAKALKVRPKDLFAWLSTHGWIYRRIGGSGWLGYQARLQSGHLEHKLTTVERTDGTEKVTEQVRITAKGLAKLAEVFGSGLDREAA
jgi:phage antirepressor YoqD-like protein